MSFYFGKEKRLKACFGIILSFALLLGYLCFLGGDIIIFIKVERLTKAQSSNQVLINTQKLGCLTETSLNFMSDLRRCMPHLLRYFCLKSKNSKANRN